MDVPIRSAYFLHDRSALNYCDDNVRVRPICHNERCVLRDHMSLEGGDYHTSRQFCSGQNSECDHFPKCVMPGERWARENLIDVTDEEASWLS